MLPHSLPQLRLHFFEWWSCKQIGVVPLEAKLLLDLSCTGWHLLRQLTAAVFKHLRGHLDRFYSLLEQKLPLQLEAPNRANRPRLKLERHEFGQHEQAPPHHQPPQPDRVRQHPKHQADSSPAPHKFNSPPENLLRHSQYVQHPHGRPEPLDIEPEARVRNQQRHAAGCLERIPDRHDRADYLVSREQDYGF